MPDINHSYSGCLSAFQAVGLPDIEMASLQNRIDTKFVFNRDQLGDVLVKLKEHYHVLEINNLRTFRYESLYFDTSTFALYNQHQCGRLNRYKIRFRNYADSGESYFEIKFKNNKGRTVKNRVSQPVSETLSGESVSFVQQHTSIDSKTLYPRIWVNYNRITLVSHNLKERLTIDIDLTFKNNGSINTIEKLVIAEVKQIKAGQSAFSRLMKQSGIRTGAISKYCLGVANMFPEVRINNFKSQLLHINKLLYVAPSGS